MSCGSTTETIAKFANKNHNRSCDLEAASGRDEMGGRDSMAAVLPLIGPHIKCLQPFEGFPLPIGHSMQSVA